MALQKQRAINQGYSLRGIEDSERMAGTEGLFVD